jgi:DNA-binding response OmpR family regulator
VTRVLVVDDEDSVRNLVCQILEIEGFQVDSAPDGEKGLHKVHEFHPDILVLDLMMPVLDGWGVLQALKDDSEHPKVVVLSARPDRTRALAAGAVECLGKPFHFRDLVAACRAAAHHP